MYSITGTAIPSAISRGQNHTRSAMQARIVTAAAASRGADRSDQRKQGSHEAQVGDEEGRQAQHERRLPPRHRQQKVTGRREHQREDKPAAFAPKGDE